MREEAWRLNDGLVGQSMPSLLLGSCKGEPVVLRDLMEAVFYFYPGSRSSAMEDDTPMVDAVQHRAFRDRCEEIAARGFGVIGISSQPAQMQYASAHANKLTHTMLTDPGCQLAASLRLPTFALDGADWYQRLVLVVRGGKIRKVFFPVLSAARSADQVLAWMKVLGS